MRGKYLSNHQELWFLERRSFARGCGLVAMLCSQSFNRFWFIAFQKQFARKNTIGRMKPIGDIILLELLGIFLRFSLLALVADRLLLQHLLVQIQSVDQFF